MVVLIINTKNYTIFTDRVVTVTHLKKTYIGVRLSGLEPEITEPKSVVFPITPQPVKTHTYFHKRVYAHFYNYDQIYQI